MLPALVLGLLFILGHTNEDVALVFIACQSLYGLAVGVIVLVQAFRQGIGTGFLTLCVPFYILYFAFAVNENPHIKALFTAALLANLAGYFAGPELEAAMQLAADFAP